MPQDFKSRDLTEAPPQRREDFFRAALEQSPMSAQILSPDGKTLWVNHAWEELWGVTLAQLGDYNMLEDQQLVAKGVMPFIQRAFAGERTEIPAILYDPEETIPDITAHQEEPGRWVRAFTFPVKDEDGKIREIVLMHEDITARKRAEEAAERWANIFEHVQWGVVIGSGDGNRLEMMNPAYAHMHGYTVAELINKPIADLYAPQTREVLAEQVRITHERGHHSFESLHMRKDGSIFPVLVQSTAMKDANGKLLYFAADDEADTRELLKAVLTQCGAEVLTAASARDALNHMKSFRPDVLISDIGMPEDDGYELIRGVRELPAERGGDVPAVALTAYARAEDRLRVLRAGYQMHVPKPVELAELVAVVASLVQRPR